MKTCTYVSLWTVCCLAFTNESTFAQHSADRDTAAVDVEGSGFMRTEVSLNVTEAPLQVILEQLERKADIRFSYRNRVMEKKRTFSVHIENYTLEKALQVIFNNSEIQFVPFPGGYVVLKERKKNNAKTRARAVISGQVMDRKTGRRLANASVRLIQRQQGSSTDREGRYAISGIEGGKYILSASYLGYNPARKQVTVTGGDTAVVNFLLTPVSLAMEELVVVGYGTQLRSQLTGSVGSVQMDEAAGAGNRSLQQALQGRVPGVQVVQTGGGKPGGSINVNIRGIGTINSESPLYVIDGVPIQGSSTGQTGNGILNTISPSDIESIDILKDASAAAIYGSRASGGVVLVTTKSGSKNGQVQVSAESSYGVQVQPKRYDVLNARQYAAYLRDVHSDPNSSGLPANFQNGERPPHNTDWQDELFRAAPLKNYNLDISGGGSRSTYSLGLGYYDEQGTMVGSGFQRYSLRANARFDAGDHVTFGGSVLLSKSDIDQNDTSGGRRTIEHAVKQAPTVPVYDDTFVGGFGWPVTGDGQDAENPVANAHLIDNTSDRYSVISSFYGEVDFLSHFTYKLQAGMDFRYTDDRVYNDFYESIRKLEVFSFLNRTRTQELNPLIEQTLNFNRSFGKNQLGILAGFSAQSFNASVVNATGQQMPRNVRSLGAASSQLGVDSEIQESSLRSIFGRITYSYDNKYLFTGNIRRDESSKLFNAVQPVGIFPSVSVGWRAGEERFLENSDIISHLKLRAGWGQLGNQSVLGNYPTAARLSSDYHYVLGNQVVQGIGPQELANDELTWETSVQTDIGFELGLFDGWLAVDLDYYNRRTEDLIWPATIPESVGLNPPFINAGTVENQGIEAAVSLRQSLGALTLDLSGNLTTIDNEVKSLGANNQLEIFEGDIANDITDVSVTRVGEPIGQFYGYVSDGLFRSWDEVYSHASQNQDPNGGRDQATASRYTAPGDIRFRDLNGDGQVDSDDKTVIGNPIPDFTYGFVADLTYKNVDLNLFIQGNYGNQILNGAIKWLRDFRQNFNQGTEYLDAWTPENSDSDIHRVAAQDPNSNMSRLSDIYVENGSYLRIKNLTLGYTFNRQLVERAGIRQLRAYMAAQNLLTLTGYSGLEPEIGSLSSGTARDAGIDRFVYPQPKQFLVGLEVGF
ncbi:SusC/RagA family TonB-linked outer membrane protein [Halalkalibaculum sp. DA384]|uniref:SusC/RagA family TonB-linked outer membrane protein n=1 Tax=Halalkalibaculum sp. DA384 TaxID=3373606 RepID=UPI0037551AE4